MRVPSVLLFVLAIAVVSSSGCKVRGKNGLAAKRPVSRGLFRSSSDRSARLNSSLATRGTADCDCYTCRMRQQETEVYVAEPEVDMIFPSEEAVELPVAPVQQSISTFRGTYIQPAVVAPNSLPTFQEIQGKLIPDNELTNELPGEPANDFVPTLPETRSEPKPEVVQPRLISPQAGVNSDREEQQEEPVVRSTSIKAKTVSSRTMKTSPDEQPTVNRSVFQLGTRDRSVLEVEKPQPQLDETIWFAPTQEPESAPIQQEPIPVQQPEQTPLLQRQEPTPAQQEPTPAQPEPTPRVAPQEVSAPIIEHEIKEIEPIVLKARPVDRHMIYNSRQPSHAPVREARLMTDSRFVPPHRQPHNTRLQFYPLPPQQPSQVSPTPIAPAAVPTAPVNPQPLVNPQSRAPLFSPVPQQDDESAELRLRASVTPTGNQENGSPLLQAPMVQVIPQSSPMLKLNAAPTSDEPQTLPAIVKIRGQGEVVVGSLKSPQQSTQQSTASGMNRLHTTPWQPMKTGTGQVQQSIRQLMIRPQQEAHSGSGGIHR